MIFIVILMVSMIASGAFFVASKDIKIGPLKRKTKTEAFEPYVVGINKFLIPHSEWRKNLEYELSKMRTMHDSITYPEDWVLLEPLVDPKPNPFSGAFKTHDTNDTYSDHKNTYAYRYKKMLEREKRALEDLKRKEDANHAKNRYYPRVAKNVRVGYQSDNNLMLIGSIPHRDKNMMEQVYKDARTNELRTVWTALPSTQTPMVITTGSSTADTIYAGTRVWPKEIPVGPEMSHDNLMKFKKAELVSMAEHYGIDVKSSWTKTDLVQHIQDLSDERKKQIDIGTFQDYMWRKYNGPKTQGKGRKSLDHNFKKYDREPEPVAEEPIEWTKAMEPLTGEIQMSMSIPPPVLTPNESRVALHKHKDRVTGEWKNHFAYGYCDKCNM